MEASFYLSEKLKVMTLEVMLTFCKFKFTFWTSNLFEFMNSQQKSFNTIMLFLNTDGKTVKLIQTDRVHMNLAFL